jgi:hypothetical protein
VSGPTDDEFGRHHFLAWSRQGIATTLSNPDYGGSLPDRPAVAVDLNVTASGPDSVTAVPTVTVHTFGPGDVLGIDPRHVVRTEPKDSTPNFEPNYLAGIEFDTPDFPWLFTPATPAGNRLRPWITLIALAQSEYRPVPGVVTPLPAIDVASIAALQPLDDAWNWAHTQVAGDAALADSDPASVVSRLLCPRRLDPETTYTAFVVPAFEIGRLAGLGLDVSAVHTSDPAWTPATGAPLRLPVFYQFGFHTSDQGDFESLVRRLVPRKFGANIGERPMAVDDPMAGVPGAGPPLMLPGALQSIAAAPSAWDDPARTQFQTAVAGLVNRVAPLVDDPSGPDPQVVPPMYGRWPAGVLSVTPGGTRWVDQLGLDPRNRTIAGMGTQVVQASQTSLMASAWQQVAGIEAANAALRQAQLARATMTMLHAQLAQALASTVLTVTAPLHAKVLASPATVRAVIDGSRVPRRLLSPAARRLTHPTAVIRRRQAAQAGVRIRPGSLLAAVEGGTASFVPPVAPPGGLVPIEQVGAAGAPGGPPWRRWFPLTLRADTPAGDFTVTIDVDGPEPVNPVTVSPDVVAATPGRPDFAVTPPGTSVPAGGPAAGADSPDAALLRQALTPLAQAWASVEPDPPARAALDMAALAGSLLERLQPADTVAARMRSQVLVGPWLNWHPADPIREIMAAPSFPQPMYAPLRDLSVQYVMPGADQIPDDSVGLVQANHAFIEAYLAGLSHELARQLLFAGYPTDCMGTYFRQFWDVSGYVPQPGDPAEPQALAELLKDIPPIVTWQLADGLGAHENRPATVPDPIVLIVRGELLRRYPDALIYAARAILDGDRRTIDDSAPPLHHIFSGLLQPDMNFFGFNLSAADAKGGSAAAPQGYFIVFQQHPSGPRFGLEPSAAGPVIQWADLAWTNFGSAAAPAAAPQVAGPHAAAPRAAGPALLPPYTEQLLASATMAQVLLQHPVPPFLSAADSPSGTAITGPDAACQWGADAAQTAYITARLPFRVAIHADLMIPEE